MKLKNGEIVDASAALKSIRKMRLPVKVSSDLVKLALKLDEPIKAFEEVKNGLVETYKITAEPTEDGKGQTVKTSGKPEDLKKFFSELDELLNLEVEVVASKVRLPEKIAGTCDKCSHNMDVPLQIEGDILLPLQSLVEIG